MAQSTTLTVRLNGPLSEFIAENVGEYGTYDNVSEYIRDLVRKDKERSEAQAFDRLQAELVQAFREPESSCLPLTASEVIARNRG